MERTARVEPTPAATPEAEALARPPAPVPTPVPPLTAEAEAQLLAATYLQQIASVLPRPPKGAVPRHGLALSAQPTRLLPDGNWHLDAVTVTNTLRQPLRLVNLPELYIETREGRHVLNRERYTVLGLASGLPADGLLQPGQSYTFTLVTRPPVWGARQFLTVAVAQTNAADEPAVLALLERAR